MTYIEAVPPDSGYLKPSWYGIRIKKYLQARARKARWYPVLHLSPSLWSWAGYLDLWFVILTSCRWLSSKDATSSSQTSAIDFCLTTAIASKYIKQTLFDYRKMDKECNFNRKATPHWVEDIQLRGVSFGRSPRFLSTKEPLFWLWGQHRYSFLAMSSHCNLSPTLHVQWHRVCKTELPG